MTKRALLLGVVAVALLSFATTAAGEPPATAVFTDMTTPGTSMTTTFTDANGDSVRQTTIDGHFTSVTNGVTGPFHTTIFRIAHAATGISDTTGVDYCSPCTDTVGNTGTIANHLLGVTGGTTHTNLAEGTDGLVADRGTFTLASVMGVTTDSGVLAKSACLGHHSGPLVVASGDSECLAPGSHQSGPVTVQAGAYFYSNGAQISGPVTATSPAAIAICGTHLSGGLTVSGATGPALIGEPATSDCTGNTIDGPVRISGDTEGTDFSGNSVSGPVTLTSNTGGFVFGDLVANSIHGPIATSGNV
jgi:hypothetical protein